MSVEANKETARRFVEEVINQHQLQNLQEFAAPDYINHDAKGQITQGVQNLIGSRTAAPDMHVTILQMLGEGDLVAVQWSASGTHQHPIAHLDEDFAGPPTGKTVTLTGVYLFRFDGDKIAEVWNHWDRHHLLEQLSGD